MILDTRYLIVRLGQAVLVLLLAFTAAFDLLRPHPRRAAALTARFADPRRWASPLNRSPRSRGHRRRRLVVRTLYHQPDRIPHRQLRRIRSDGCPVRIDDHLRGPALDRGARDLRVRHRPRPRRTHRGLRDLRPGHRAAVASASGSRLGAQSLHLDPRVLARNPAQPGLLLPARNRLGRQCRPPPKRSCCRP